MNSLTLKPLFPERADPIRINGFRRSCMAASRFRWLLIVFPVCFCFATVWSQSNLSINTNATAACGAGTSATVFLQFLQPPAGNVISVNFDLRFRVSDFQSVFVASNDSGNKPLIKKIGALGLPDHSLNSGWIPESDPAADGNPATAEWRVSILDIQEPWNLIPETLLLSLQFFTAATATTGPHSIEIRSIVASDDVGNEYYNLTGSNGRITLTGCSSPNLLFLPLILKQ